MAAKMLCGGGKPDAAALHPGLARFITTVDDLCHAFHGQTVTTGTVALAIVLWQESYPQAVAYKGK